MRRLRYLLFELDSSWMPVASGVVAVGWGLLLLLTNGTFTSSPSYSAMLDVAPADVWGLILLGAGGLQLTMVLTNWHWLMQGINNAWLTGIWTFLTLGLFWGNPLSTGVTVYPWLALLSAWRMFRAFRERHRL